MAAPIHPVTMPKWGIEMTQGTLNQWSVEQGARVTKGDPLLEVETDKIVNTVESPATGYLRRIVATTGDTLPVGTLLAVLADESVSDAEINAFIGSFKGATVSFEPEGEPAAAAADTKPAPASAGAEAGEDVRVSPIARRIAQSLGIDISKVTGTGRNGRISKEDVENYAATLQSGAAAGGETKPAATAGGAVAGAAVASGVAGTPLSGGAGDSNTPTVVRMSAMRASIAKRLLESKQTIPHYRVRMDINIDTLTARRKQLSASSGSRITLNDMLVRAAGLALVKHPNVNAQLHGEEIRQFPHADISLAVATDGGLITPIVRGADLKSLNEISALSAQLAERARTGSLTRDEITGGTFTISNLGMFGVDQFDAIINPPQVAILAVGAATERVIARGGVPAVASILTVTLSADHRVVDGAVGAAFLASLRDLLQSPETL